MTNKTTLNTVSYIPAVNALWAQLCEDGTGAMLYTVNDTHVVFYEASWSDIEAGVPMYNWFVLDADFYCVSWMHCQQQVDEYFAQPEPESPRKSWLKWFTH